VAQIKPPYRRACRYAQIDYYASRQRTLDAIKVERTILVPSVSIGAFDARAYGSAT